jgi:DeoR/GlpR family transcriptional regulator of sugar metabolism
MLKEERLQKILVRLQQDQKVLLPTLSAELNVSEDTVRRDIRELSTQGLLKMVRGGAVPHAPGPQDFRERVNFASEDKQLIAKKAVGMLKDGQVIIFDGGTSALAVASLLPKSLRVTIVTNSFPIADILQDHPHAEVLFAGGRLLKNSVITTGIDTIRFYQNVRADICFLGVCSIHLQLGLTGHYYEECEVKKTMVAASGHVVALSTPDKVNTAESFYICPATAVHTIITSAPEDEKLVPFREAGMTVV